MTTCDCQCHVNPRDYVACCPTHRLPLHAAEAGTGQCPWIGPKTEQAHFVGGVTGYWRRRCITWSPRNWHWVHRDMFNGEDLPPYNGHLPPRYPSPGGPTWERHEHRCSACERATIHVVGDNRSVCTACGAAAWVPDPQYVNVGDAL